MLVKGSSAYALTKALERIQGEFGNNITLSYKNVNSRGAAIRFRLSVIDSKKAGSRISPSGRRISAACWHVWGRFFEEVFKNTPGASFKGGFHAESIITNGQGNWEDYQIGSEANPMMASEACDCDN